MFRSLQQKAATDTGCMLQGTETAELAIITEDSIIRRIYLNNRTVPMEVDSCSLVSILASDRLENNKIMKIVRRTEFKLLGHVHSGGSDCGIEMLHEIHQEKRQHPYIDTSSDDPRRGGKRGRQGMTASRKEYRDRLQMEPPRAMSSGTSKIQEEEESSDSDSEFYDAVSVIHELKDQTNHNTGHTSMTKTDNPGPYKDAINDS